MVHRFVGVRPASKSLGRSRQVTDEVKRLDGLPACAAEMTSMKAATLTRASSKLAYSVMSSQGEPSWSKQRFLAVRVGTPAQAKYTSSQLSNTGPSGQVPHTSSTPGSPPQAATRTSSPTTKIRIKINITPPPHRLMDRTGVVKVA